MDEMTRRSVLNLAMGAGVATALAQGEAADGAVRDEAQELKFDRECVLASGMTEAEADCWEAVGRVAKIFFELPELHPMDKQDIANAVHVIQYRLLSRPTYRKYKESHKAITKKGQG